MLLLILSMKYFRLYIRHEMTETHHKIHLKIIYIDIIYGESN